MKILIINSVCGIGSTGRICVDLAQQFEKQGHTVKIAYGRDGYVPEQFRKYAVRIGTDIDTKLHAIKTRLMDGHGFGSKKATRKFLEWVDEYEPEMIWLHNIHGYYINIELLFSWIKRHPQVNVKWTLHDCWAFTGHCSHFTAVRCEKWKDHCSNCVQKREYPACIFIDRCKKNYDKKRSLFSGVEKMELITPSKWLAGLVKQSFLAEYPVEVSYNTIDYRIFRPTCSDFRQRYGLQNKKIILSVASVWNERKGLRDFINLSHLLDDNYAFVIVGVDKKQLQELPEKVIGIQRTNNSEELAQIYSAADVFFNPTHEDNFPTVNLEAQACNTWVVTYNAGGSAETIQPNMGIVVDVGDINHAKYVILERCADK